MTKVQQTFVTPQRHSREHIMLLAVLLAPSRHAPITPPPSPCALTGHWHYNAGTTVVVVTLLYTKNNCTIAGKHP